ncbi:MAG: pyridoxine 5'-phosphate synthase [Planctomycetia bacterium]|nr:MAG: pyridoxine 5'-phosphate synthase [Planctomycetia bacterium]
MIRLGVNIDHVATIRQARGADEPDPVWAAVEAELGGADTITFHLREDRRHVSDRDAEVLRRTVAGRLNMEMSSDAGIVRIALRLKPHQCTLVPERRQEVTTEGGLNVVAHAARLRGVVRRLRGAGIEVSAFIEPDAAQVRAAAKCGFNAIELWTGGYAHARTRAQTERALRSLGEAIDVAHESGLVVHAGHGLTYRNVDAVAALAGFTEFNIGHSIVARSVFVGMREAVREMKRLLDRASQHHVAIVDAEDLLGHNG